MATGSVVVVIVLFVSLENRMASLTSSGIESV